MPGAEIEIIGRYQIAEIGKRLGDGKAGSYYIDDPTVLVPGTDKARLFNWLMLTLAREYPEYTWWEVTSLKPSERTGLTVEWKPKVQVSPAPTHIEIEEKN